MKRSQINKAVAEAKACFARWQWHLPPHANWDITDFGLQDFDSSGLVLINLAEEPEYCEKLMYAKKDQQTPLHYHKKKKEDIICRNGELTLVLWLPSYREEAPRPMRVKINGQWQECREGEPVVLRSGERITLEPLVWHLFYPSSEECIIGEVSTANDDVADNFFANPEIGRFPGIIEDEKPAVNLFNEA